MYLQDTKQSSFHIGNFVLDIIIKGKDLTCLFHQLKLRRPHNVMRACVCGVCEHKYGRECERACVCM